MLTLPLMSWLNAMIRHQGMNDQHHFNIRENRCEGLNIQTPLQYALRCKYVIGETVQGLQVVELYFTMENNFFPCWK